MSLPINDLPYPELFKIVEKNTESFASQESKWKLYHLNQFQSIFGSRVSR